MRRWLHTVGIALVSVSAVLFAGNAASADHRHHGRHHQHYGHHNHGSFWEHLGQHLLYDYALPSIFGAPGYSRDSYYYPSNRYYADYYYNAQPAPVIVQQAPNLAQIQVIIPDPEGEVWFNGGKTRQTGTTRVFTSPPVEPGYTYNYQISAAWHQNGRLVTEERTVQFQAGQNVVVDFARPAVPPQAVAPAQP